MEQSEYEIGLVAWCLHNPLPPSLVAQIQNYHFTELRIKAIWPHLLGVYQTHGEWPTLGEAQAMLLHRLGNDPMRLMYSKFLEQCYHTRVTGYSGEAIKQWLTSRELTDVGATLQALASKTHEEQVTELQELQFRLDSVTNIDITEVVPDEFEPLSDAWLDNVDEMVEEVYGAEPLPTGIQSLDDKLKGGGVRPHGIMVFGPTGGGKTVLVVNVAAHTLKLGGRVIYFALDDSAAEISERFYGHMLGRSVDFEEMKASGELPAIKQKLRQLKQDKYGGHLVIKAMEPEQHKPSDIIRILDEMVVKFRASDIAAGVPEEEAGVLDLVVIDTTDQLLPDRSYKESWYEVGKTHQSLCRIPERYNCPFIAVVQGGQQTIGAPQLTERDIGEGYGKAKPYKLILGVAQTNHQYHADQTVNIADSLVQDNLHNMHNYNYPADKDTTWKPFTLCLIKNTRARNKRGAANKVKIPMLVSYASCRVIVDYTQPESGMSTAMQTQRDEMIAAQGPPKPKVPRKKVVRE